MAAASLKKRLYYHTIIIDELENRSIEVVFDYSKFNFLSRGIPMAMFKITGERELKGRVELRGAKNAALKILPAAILANGVTTIHNVPDILDIRKTIEILQSIGARISFADNTVVIDSSTITSSQPDEKLVNKLRGSIVLIGALLAKFGDATFSQPGGCLIGARPIDDHLDVFKQMGVTIRRKEDRFMLSGKPKASRVVLKKMSVTATENAILASVFSSGITRIEVAAAEPEIADLAKFLNAMGAKISGAGTHEITIEGVKELKPVTHSIIPDRIEAGTYIMFGLATNSEIEVGPIIPEHLEIVFKRLVDAGAEFDFFKSGGNLYVRTKKHRGLTSQDCDTRTYPGFPTDLQSPYTALMTQTKGECTVFETIFEGRFGFVEELKMMRADINVLNPHELKVSGPTKLKSNSITSRDIRGGAALVLAALVAHGTTTIEDIEFIDRGYEQMDIKLQGLGAEIERID